MLSKRYGRVGVLNTRQWNAVNHLNQKKWMSNGESSTGSTGKSNFNLVRLENGVRVTSENRGGEVATIGVSLEVGSLHQRENNGVAHFTQKLALKRPSLGKELREIGGEMVSYSNRDRTVFLVRCLQEEVEKGVEVLGSVVKNVKSNVENRTNEEVKKEVFEEMEKVLLNEEEVVLDHLHSVGFQRSSLGFSVLGSEEKVKEIKGKDIESFIEENYVGGKVVVSGVGVSQERLVEAVKKSSLLELGGKGKRGGGGGGGEIHYNSDTESFSMSRGDSSKQEYLGSMVNARDDTLSNIHIAYGVKAPGLSEERYLIAKVLESLLGEWEPSQGVANNSTSRLCETVALEGLGTKIKAFYSAYHEVGLLGVYGVTGHEQIEDFSVEVLTEFVRLSRVSQAEVERGKTKVKSQLLTAFNNSTSTFDLLSQQAIYQARALSLNELLTRVDSITQSEVQALASEILYDVDPVIAAYGPTLHLPDYNRMRSWIYWNRL